MATKKVTKKASGATKKKTVKSKKKTASTPATKKRTAKKKPAVTKKPSKEKAKTEIRVSKKKAEEALRKGAERVTDEDVQQVLDKADELRGRFESGGPLGKFASDFMLLLALVRAYWNKSYRDVPYWTIAAVVAALIYVINPFDMIPDAIPFIGYVDDAAVVAACIALVRKDLRRFQKWQAANA